MSFTNRRGFAFRTRVLVVLVLALLATLVPSVASARENFPVATFCDDLELNGCDGSIELPNPTQSGFFEQTGLHLVPAMGDLAGSLPFDGPAGGPAGAGISWTGGGDGILGVGFDLTGIPSFDRCPRTPLLDDDTSGDLGLTDPPAQASWCLNGARLEDVSDNGTEFRTKVENGQSVVVAGGGWNSSSLAVLVTDRVGTTITFDYQEKVGADLLRLRPTNLTTATGKTVNWYWTPGVEPVGDVLARETSLDSIRWGGNATSGRADDYELTFTYEDRAHARTGWIGGQAYATSERLATAELRHRDGGTNTPLKQWQLTYLPSTPYDARTYLTEVRRCEQYSGGSWSLCTNPTVYEWDNVQESDSAFAAVPGANHTKWVSAPNGGELSTPYEVGKYGSLRQFYTRSNGTTGFYWRQPTTSSPLPEIELRGPVVFESVSWRIDSFSDSFDITRLVSDRDYWHQSTVCTDRTMDFSDNPYSPDVCGSGPLDTWCLFNWSSIPPGAQQILDDMSDAQFDECFKDRDDYLPNRVYESFHNAFAGQLASLQSSIRLFGDLDCDGLDDDWIEPNFFSASDTSFGSGTGPQLTATNEIVTVVSTVGVQGGHNKTVKRFEGVVRSLADAYGGLILADFNADCFGDLYQMYGNSFHRDYIWQGDGAGSFARTNGPVTWLQHLDAGWVTTNKEARFKMQVRNSDKGRFRLGHFNNDRYLDVAYVNGYADDFSPGSNSPQRSEVSVFLNDGDGTWTKVEDGYAAVVRRPLELSPNDTPMALALTNRDIGAIQFAEMNGDGCADMVLMPRPLNKNSNSAGQVAIFASKCDGSFHPTPMLTPVQMSFVGKDKTDGRSLGVWHVDGTGDIPEEFAQLWMRDTAETNSVKLADFNGDGLTDMYEITGARDRVWLNLGTVDSNNNAQFAPMQALDYRGHGLPSTAGGGTHPDVTWTTDAQHLWDISRYIPVAYDGSVTPGMWIGGALTEESGGGDLIMGPDRYYASNFRIPRLSAYTDSFGNRVDFEWGFHREAQDPLASRFVVTAVNTSIDATSGGGTILSGTATGKRTIAQRTEFSYQGHRVDPVHGSLGFESVTAEQVAPQQLGRTKEIVTFWQDDHRRAGMPKERTTQVSTNAGWRTIARTRTAPQIDWLDEPEWGNRSDRSYRLIANINCATGWGKEETFHLDGTLKNSACTTTSVPDIYGNLDWIRTEHEDGSVVEVTHAFTGANSNVSDAEMRAKGLVSARVTTTTAWDGDTHVETIWTKWDTDRRLPLIITEPLDGTSTRRYEHLAYDTEGNPDLRRTGGTGVAEREETLTWDGRLPSTTTVTVNGVDHLTGMTHGNPEIDAPTVLTDVNGVSVSSTFDAAGRLFNTYGETVAAVRHVWGSAPTYAERALYGALWVDWTLPQEGPATSVAYDRHGRVVREGIQTAIGMSYVNTFYDERGLAVETSTPYVPSSQLDFESRNHLNVVETNDALGRPVRVVDVEGVVSEATYDQAALPAGVTVGPYYAGYPAAHLRTVTTTTDGVTSHAISDAAGQPVAVVNGVGDHQHFGYDALGNVTNLRDDAGNETVRVYDSWGRMLENRSPDLGTTVNRYDARGNLLRTTDEKGNRTAFNYDVLDRIKIRVTSTPGGALDDISSYVYDSAANGIGLLSSYGSLNERVEYTYTSLSQVNTETRRVGPSGSDETREMRFFYDALGRVERVGFGGELFIDREYDPNTGAVIALRDAEDDSLLWQAGGYDDYGRLVLTAAGNNTASLSEFEDTRAAVETITAYDPDGAVQSEQTYDWDARGNLDRRTFQKAPQAPGGPLLGENFTYDNLNRLETSQVDGRSAVTRSYNNLGHLRTKSNYSNSLYIYGAGSAGPNAATRVGPNQFQYDVNGNMVLEQTQTKFGQIRTVATFSWTAHNKLDTAQRFSLDGTLTAEVNVTYGASGDKVHQRVEDLADSEVTESWYFTQGYRRVVVDGTARSEIDVIAPTGPVATVTISEATGLAATTYHQTDHLGSPIEHTDESGAVTAHRSYSVDGGARDPDTWAALPLGDDGEALFEDGFTGHDMLAEFGLVNMGARIYDQRRAQFIQADTHDGELRYGYANNNPLSFVDPDGNSAASLLHFAGNFAFNSLSNHFGVGYSVGTSYGSSGAVATYGAGATQAIAVSDVTTSSTSGGGGKSWGRIGAEVATGVVIGVAAAALTAPLGPGAVAVGIFVGETATIALFALIDGADIMDRLAEQSTFSGLISVFRGESVIDVLQSGQHWFNLLTGLFGGKILGGIGDSLRKLDVLPSAETMRAAADAIAGLFQRVVVAGKQAGQAVSNGWSQFRQLIDDVVQGPQQPGGRGLSKHGGVISRTSTNAAGGSIYTSTGGINQNDFAGIVNGGLIKGDDIHIITGGHGAADGSLIPDVTMFADDVLRFGDIPGVHVHDLPNLTPDQVKAILAKPGTIIGGFCFSGACLAKYGL